MQPSPAKAMDPEAICYVIMPFSDTEHEANGCSVKMSTKAWNHFYEKWIARAVEGYRGARLECRRSPRQPGNFVNEIIKDLHRADLVIADITGCRPNVLYELGVRHAMKRVGTLVITQEDIGCIPSDLRGYFVLRYRYNGEATEYESYYQEFAAELQVQLRKLYTKEVADDNPVARAVGTMDAFEPARGPWPSPSPLCMEIVSATYGLMGTEEDVTQRLRALQMTMHDRFAFLVWPDVVLGHDPAVGYKKRLRITYRIDNTESTIERMDRDLVNLPL